MANNYLALVVIFHCLIITGPQFRAERYKIFHLQQYLAVSTRSKGINVIFHAGVLDSILDSACGYAAYTMMPDQTDVLTIEFKISFLKPANANKRKAGHHICKNDSHLDHYKQVKPADISLPIINHRIYCLFNWLCNPEKISFL